jgi:uncharacterized repeat protein (TIGR02543 family)
MNIMNNKKGINLFAIAAIFLLTVTARNVTAQQQRPGNISTNSTLIGWFTPDNYQNGTWTNRITTAGTIGNLTQPSTWTATPPNITIGNFHPAVMFRPTVYTSAPHRMISENNFTIGTADAFTFILVYKPQTPTWDDANILNFYDFDNDDSYDRKNISYASSGSDVLSTYWPNNQQRSAHGDVPSGTTQLVTIDNNNSTAVLRYLGGTYLGYDGSAQGTANNKLVIGSSRNNLATVGRRSFTGDIQELVILKRNDKVTYPYLSSGSLDDLDRIHSYLAIKYGIVMPANYLNYLASDATTVVWDKAFDTAYNNHIFGIARDDGYGLYQKQSQSASYPLLTVFVGNSLATLNSGNSSGKLDDGVYAMFGSNGGNLSSTVTLSTPLPTPGSTPAVNYRKDLMYRVQLTGTSTLKLKFKSGTGALPEYMLISMDPTFPPGSTQVISTAGTVEGEVRNGSYIAFGGHKTESTDGPGGVGGSNLKLWLRADDAASIVTELLTAGSGKLRDYPTADAPTGAIVPAVSEWRDDVRGQTYSYAMGGTGDSHLEPVYQPSNYMTNYHPALRYWGTGISRSTWLGNTSTNVFSEQRPVRHSAFFLVNNDFGTNDWVYTMMFGSAERGSYRGPGYGVQKNGNIIVGRFRTSSTEGTGSVDLFKTGATSILGYHHNWPSGTGGTGNSSVKFRFNGLEDSISGIVNGNIGLNQASMIGPGYEDNRVIQGVISEVILYNGALSQANLQRIESYLALKYGITLTPRPKGGQAQKFDYIFSDNRMLWNGTAGAGTIWDTYYHRVAAVIRDDDAGLHNRQSHSTNVGSILHMGVAGSRLGSNADLGDFASDTEAVIWGDNNGIGTPAADIDPNGCGDFSNVFNRRWLVHKRTEGNRPIRMLVGAQNNSGNQLGNDAGTTDLFNKLANNYSVYMIVADSAEKLTPGHSKYGQFTAVVPMQFLDGEQQCSYTFSDSITYITFGYKIKTVGCAEVAAFEGVKTFNWTQWTRQTYATLTKGAVDLGDGVRVENTTVTYDLGVTAPANYPSVTSSPVAGSLYLQRRNGALGASKVTVTINLNTPVRPEFSIYDIDGYYGRFEKITVRGSCNSGGVSPTLSYAGNPTTSYYTISGNTATANVRKNLSPTDKNGQLNVSFSEGITQIVIEFAITNQMQVSTTHNLIISPIRFRQVPPPPPINEDGLSFTKEVNKRDISTCEPVEYSFYIRNVNCDGKFVNFRDTLPVGMKWTVVGLSVPGSQIKFNSYEGSAVLHIDSLYVPGAGEQKVMATAVIDESAVPVGNTRQFDNDAWIKYEQIVSNIPYNRLLQSVDRETLAKETWFNAIGGHRQDTVRSIILTSVNKYSADSTVAIVITVKNPAGNDAIPESYLDVNFDAGFTYVVGSFSSSVSGTEVASSAGSLSIAGNSGGTAGFEIPAGESTYAFKLKAPTLANLVKEATGEISPLQIEYIFTSSTTDPCIISGMVDVSGTHELPYKELIANADRTSTITGVEVAIPVLDNDSIPSTCNTLKAEITTIPLHGNAGFVNDSIRYTSYTDYAGYDTLVYQISCDGDTAIACVYIYVAEKPDNISEADCYVPAHQTVWDMEKKAISDAEVFWLATPFVGDLDGDGKVKVVAPSVAVDNANNATSLLVFNDSLKLIRTVTPNNGRKLPNINTMTFLIADVDNDGKGEIVTATTNNTLMCFSNLGAEKWGGETVAFIASGNPSLIVADINSDGYAEILAGNSIYAGESGKLLVTLPMGGSNGWGAAAGGPASTMPVFADMDNDGLQEVVAGNTVYKVTITNRNGTTNNKAEVLAQINLPDGFTSVADIDLDGDLDVIVTGGHATLGGTAILYVWDGATSAQIGQTLSFSSTDKRISRAFAGDIDGDGRPDIAFTYTYSIAAYSYDPGSKTFAGLWTKATTDQSGATTMSMFDFDQNGRVELVYRDMNSIRIINEQGNNITELPCYSNTHTEYPVVVDLDRDGHADILVSGSETPVTPSVTNRVHIIRYGSKTPGQWASARSVWNQHAYNAVNITDSLRVPRYPMNPAAVFTGPDGQFGVGDDLRPYNAFLKQQTTIDTTGVPIWLTPDAVFDDKQISVSMIGDSVSISICIVNRGDAALGSPVYASLYRDSVKPTNRLATDSLMKYILPGDTGCLSVGVGNVSSLPSFVQFVVRLNDDGVTDPYPVQAECDCSDSIRVRLNPALYLLMEKEATLNGVQDNGTYPNPVSALYSDVIEYKITAVNANLNPSGGTLVIRDTLPAYLRYATGTASSSPPSSIDSSTIAGTPPRDTLVWTFTGLSPLERVTVTFGATPESGVSASQPMFVNRAWVTIEANGDTLHIPTVNSTYHQGAGVSTVTFSASAGGEIFNATPQVLDFRTSPRSGVLVVPNDGYRFAGWSHDEYAPLRGERMEARSGIMLYDTLVVYGNVELHASFVPEEYPVRYYLHGGENAEGNPSSYTIESGTITLGAPSKPGDVFAGWTGTNGGEPQLSVVIASGSTGERDYYANYLYSGREDAVQETTETDKIWSSGNEAYICTSRSGSIVRIYTTDGVLHGQRTILAAGTTKIKLDPGVYIVTLNNGTGQKIIIK